MTGLNVLLSKDCLIGLNEKLRLQITFKIEILQFGMKNESLYNLISILGTKMINLWMSG